MRRSRWSRRTPSPLLTGALGHTPSTWGSAWLPRAPSSILGREEEKGCGTVDRKLVQRMRKGKCLPLGKICLQDLLRKEEHGSSLSPTMNSSAVPPRYRVEPRHLGKALPPERLLSGDNRNPASERSSPGQRPRAPGRSSCPCPSVGKSLSSHFPIPVKFFSLWGSPTLFQLRVKKQSLVGLSGGQV